MKCALVCVALAACVHPQTQTPNDVFRAAYHDARARALAAAGPVLLVDGDHLILIDGARREQATIRDAQYHALKQSAHGALGVYAALADVDGPLPDDRKRTLWDLRVALQQTNAVEALSLANGVLADGASKRADLDAWAHKVGPQLLAAAQQAAAVELAALDDATKRFQAALGERWQRVHVVVIGSHMARDREIAMDYFLHALGESAEGGRVIYAESLWQEPQALELLGTHLIDAEVARGFFGDPMRLHRDLLSK
jgi:hypothetical protein